MQYDASWITDLPLIHQGKVRDIFAVGDDALLIVASDRLSAFDVVLPQPIPGKGELLTRISNFWFRRTRKLCPNHLSNVPLQDVIEDAQLRARLKPRAVIVKKLQALPLEAIVRGYLIGSGWKDYRRTGAVSGIRLSAGLQQAERLAQPIFTPSTKAAVGDHDENISFEQIEASLGTGLAAEVKAASLAIYEFAADYARRRGILIADTKFEFGLDADGRLMVMDEMLTPDSSRFWPQSSYATGISPPSYDKQFIRDYLETLDWDKTPPGPRIPDAIIEATAAKYREAYRRLTANSEEE